MAVEGGREEAGEADEEGELLLARHPDLRKVKRD